MSSSRGAPGHEWSDYLNNTPSPICQVSDNTFLNNDRLNAIREGKQKARETMAAAGFDASPSPASRPQSSTPNGNSYPNGAPSSSLSRKRSRDGTLLPLSSGSASDGAGEPAPSHDEILLDRYIQRDLLATATMNDHLQRSRDLLMTMEHRKNIATMEFEERRRRMAAQPQPPPIIYSVNRPPPNKRRPRELTIKRKDNQQQAEQHEELVPVRLDLELDKLRLRDTFTWNLHEKLISQDQFIDFLLEDLRVPPENLAEVGRHVKAEMQEQILNYYPHLMIEEGPLEPGRPYFEHKDDEMRIQIKLNITIGTVTLIDQFEWDINNPENSPEDFARQMAAENALSGEFTTAIAHSIREQSQLYTKSLYLTNHPFDGRPVEDPELKDSFLPAPIHSAFRPQQTQKDFTPFMYEMSEAELDRTETSMMREHRANKRQLNRRGGPALPDLKDRQRTVRSLVVHSVIPGAAETFDATGIPKTRRARTHRPRGSMRNDGDIESDELESDDSGPDSPAPSSLQQSGGTARQRGMRGAAAVAQASLRAGYGRSQTPDSTPAHEPRSARRSMLREESVVVDDDGASQLIVRLKINKAKFRAWVEETSRGGSKKKGAEYGLSGYASHSSGSTPQHANGGKRNAAAATPAAVEYDEKGAVDIDLWPGPENEPPKPPQWLQADLAKLQSRAPQDDFSAHMRPYLVNIATGAITTAFKVEPGNGPPNHSWKIQWQPRLRCNDCAGKWYNVRRGHVVEDFEVHLKNRNHNEMVKKRVEAAKGK